jgi:hypothetical protein
MWDHCDQKRGIVHGIVDEEGADRSATNSDPGQRLRTIAKYASGEHHSNETPSLSTRHLVVQNKCISPPSDGRALVTAYLTVSSDFESRSVTFTSVSRQSKSLGFIREGVSPRSSANPETRVHDARSEIAQALGGLEFKLNRKGWRKNQ